MMFMKKSKKRIVPPAPPQLLVNLYLFVQIFQLLVSTLKNWQVNLIGGLIFIIVGATFTIIGISRTLGVPANFNAGDLLGFFQSVGLVLFGFLFLGAGISASLNTYLIYELEKEVASLSLLIYQLEKKLATPI